MLSTYSEDAPMPVYHYESWGSESWDPLQYGRPFDFNRPFFEQFKERFPNVDLKEGIRFVDNPEISHEGGLTSGIDLALHVVERYFGTEVAQTTAEYMEYESEGWKTGQAVYTSAQ